MGVVVINGKGYDSRTGLPMEQTLSFAVERPVIEIMPTTWKKSRRTSKQERLAAAVAREFEEETVATREPAIQKEIVEQTQPTVTGWVGKFLSGAAAEYGPIELRYTTAEWAQEHIIGKQFVAPEPEFVIVDEVAPGWITNYLDGNDPIEIEPIIREVETTEPAWISSYLAGEAPIEIEPVGLIDHREAAQILQGFTPTRVEPHFTGRAPERSETLNREFVKKPIQTEQLSVAHKYAQVAKHPEVFRFERQTAPVIREVIAPDVIKKVPEAKQSVEDALLKEYLAAPFQPIAKKTETAEPAVAAETKKDVLKDALINEQIATPVDFKSRRDADRQAEKYGKRRFFRAPTIITAALAVVVLGGYFTYVNMPAISIRVAANQAGIEARVPYTANGYSIDGPVAYASGQIKINYKSNGDAAGYSVVQQESDWSDVDIIRGLVRGEKYRTINIDGMRIYRYGNDASWVKSGMLYTINGNELLGDDQITKIAESV